MTTDFFRRVAARPYRRERDEREDRLTEILAAVLEHEACQDLAAYLAYGWLTEIELGKARTDPASAAVMAQALQAAGVQPHISTQQRMLNGTRRADLVMTFAHTTSLPITFCVEAKLDAHPERGQLQAYVDWISARSGPGIVIFIGPRDEYRAYDPTEIPTQVAQISWETTARLLRNYVDEKSLLPVGDFLVRELLKYMHNEEGLVDPIQLSRDHLKALELYSEADAAATRLYEIAEEYLLTHGETQQQGKFQTDRDDSYYGIGLKPEPIQLPPNPQGDSPGLWFEIYWDGNDSFPEMESHLPVVTVGMYKQRWMDAASLEVLAQSDFREYERALGNYKYDGEMILRVIGINDKPPALLGGATLEDQGAAVGEWASQALDDLRQALQKPAAKNAISSLL